MMIRLYSCFLLFLATLMAASASASASHPVIKSGYWASWLDTLPPSSIDTTLFTHIYYAFLVPSNITYKFEVTNSTALLMSNFTTTLRFNDPPVKTLVSIGGAELPDPLVFAKMASNSFSRSEFINSSIEVARKFGFDGMDLDWEFPANQDEMRDLGILLKEWRAAIEEEAATTGRPSLYLAAAVYYSVNVLRDNVYRKYPVESMVEHMDWINPMTYDYHGSWEPTRTGAHTALFDPKSNLSTNYGLMSWIEAGVPKQMLVMGLAMYGRVWDLEDPNANWVGAPSVAPGPNISTLTFSQIEEFNKANGSTVVHDIDTVSTYSFAGTKWVGYDDELAVMKKLWYAQVLGIRGYFFWNIDGDSDWKISKQASKAWVLK
uniref:GH18 domain-containing protein n=1 Tax=Kalanchoe fedtschenkoi TaxID=63787 RepID=A0A7N0V7D2_KALFE